MSAQKSQVAVRIRWLGTFLSLALLVYLLARQWDELVAAFRQISLVKVFVVLVLMLISRVAVGSRWHMLLRVTPLDVTWVKSQQLTFAGLFASNFLPTTIGGDVFRLAGAIQYRLDGPIAAASLIVDRLVGMLGMALVLPLGLPPLWGWFASQSSAPQAAAALGAALPKYWQKFTNALKRVGQSLLLWRSHPKALLLSLVFTGIHQLCLYLAITFFLKDFNETIPWWQIPGFWSFTYFVTLLPISINGYGLQELALTFFFVQVGGLSASTALAVAVLMRITQMLASLPGAAFVPAIMAGEDPKEQSHV